MHVYIHTHRKTCAHTGILDMPTHGHTHTCMHTYTHALPQAPLELKKNVALQGQLKINS